MTPYQEYLVLKLATLADHIIDMSEEELAELDRKLRQVPGPQARALSNALKENK